MRLPGTARVFIIDKGRKREFPDLETFHIFYEGDPAKMVLASAQLNSVPTGPRLQHGAKLQSGSSDPRRYFLVEGGVKREIGDWNTFHRYHFQEERAQILMQYKIDALPKGDVIIVGSNTHTIGGYLGEPPPEKPTKPEWNGGPVRLPGTARIFLIDQGRRREFPDVETFHIFYEGDPAKVVLESAQLAALPIGPRIQHGARLQSGSKDPRRYFLVERGIKREIGGWDSFYRYNFQEKRAQILPQNKIDALPIGAAVSVGPDTHTIGGYLGVKHSAQSK